MKLALIGAEYEENLALRYLAASAREAGHQVEILPFGCAEEIPRVVAAVLAGDFAFVGLSMAFQHFARDFLGLAAELRARGYRGHLCAGGHLVTPAWREVLAEAPALDTVIRHDGELTLTALLARLDEPAAWREIPGVCCRDERGEPVAAPPRRQPDELDRLPWPLRDRPHAVHVGFGFAPLVASRGCFANCNYCCINSWHRSSEGKRYRRRSAADVADEMAYLYHDRDVRLFCFHDDTFFMPRPRDSVRMLGELGAELARRRVERIGVVGKARPDHLDAELIRAAKAFGICRIYLGVENGSDAGLLHLNRLHDLASCERALELLRAAELFSCFNILLFEPDCRLEDLEANLAFLARYVDFPFNFCRAEVYSGSAYERILREQGRLEGNYLGFSYEIQDPRAELAFRLSSVCFRGRNFAPVGVANSSTGLGYEAAVLRHFYGEAAAGLCAEVEALTCELGRDTVEKLAKLVAFAREAPLDDVAGATRFAEELATEINFRDLELARRQGELHDRIAAFGRARALERERLDAGAEHGRNLEVQGGR